ncbi:GHMP kinase [candidate division MSBL1 archaeon SCGC-AAA259B11]|uniref:Beta-ribofuranosylaminobenzene 5'-phosphate synthase n=1 Tax=candidate division MSBL1 archaeon SCGC-AAA259B11 TaxID=1698260 RepID=A0A133U785_9EURY|nr:GHMP kinase [candidate division MSBL1 archaeon SCGC-AAA259B11]
MREVTVRAPAHLHAGNFDLAGDLGRLYGTVGFAIEDPSLEIVVREDEGISAEDEDARRFAERFVEKHDIGGVEIEVKSPLPKYVGIGHHTTLALSIGKALSRLYGLSLSLEDIARVMRRGLITALGLYACKAGGFIVEGGFKPEKMEEMVPPLLFRRKIPEDWCFVVAIPEKSRGRLTDLREEEDEILKNLRSMSEDLSAELSRLVLVGMMPSIIEEDVEGFGDSLTAFNSKLGSVWSDYQEGTYCNDVVRDGIETMRNRSYCGCQSSWGPTFYGLVDSKRDAADLTEQMRVFLDDNGGGEVFYTKAQNEGLEVI